MDQFKIMFDSISNIAGGKFIQAFLFLVVGFFIALVIRFIITKFLRLLKVNSALDKHTGSNFNVEGIIGKLAYYVTILFAVVGALDCLELEMVSEPLQNLLNTVLDYLPKLLSGGALVAIVWLIATVVRTITEKGLHSTNLVETLSVDSDDDIEGLGGNIGNILYWLVWLIGLPAILGAFNFDDSLLLPLQNMVQKLLGMLPNVFGAGIIGFVGWLVAKILRDITTNLLGSTGLNSFGRKVGFEGNMSLSRLCGLLVFIFIFIPALITALDALKIEAISGPATAMLNSMMGAIPNVFAAVVILTLAYILARFVSNLASTLLGGIGFDTMPGKLGLGNAFTDGTVTPSNLVGNIIIFFIMLFAVTEASGQLGFSQVEEIVSTLISFGGQVLLGIVILGVGFWISNLAYNTIIRVSGANAKTLASITRFVILGLVFAMALRSMGIADDIVNIAFSLTLGAIAVAFALSFGLGGREAAGKQMEYWMSQLRK